MKLNPEVPRSLLYRYGERGYAFPYGTDRVAQNLHRRGIEPAPRTRNKLSTRRWGRDDLLNAIRTLVTTGRFEDAKLLHTTHTYVEEVSWVLRAKPGDVRWCFQRLNLEGIMGQRANRGPHDTRRDPFLRGRGRGDGRVCGGSGWQASAYGIRTPKTA